VTTDREELIPLLRGVSHAWAFWFALAAAIVLIVLAPPGDARWAAAVYGVGLCALFAGSGLYHRWRWSPRLRPLLRRIDHSTIFLFIAASYTPIALLVLEGGLRWVVFAGVWAGALVGVGLSVAWITAPRVVQALCYLGLGWFALIALPQLASKLPVAPLTLFVAGGVLYTVGAIVYATQRPDPWPRTFGFHEIFHVFVIAAAVVHFVAIAGWIIPSG
jgi:hemolysin III